MPASQLKLLFSLLRVGNLTLRNRIVFLPHGNNYAIGGMPGEQEAYYFGERAKGGAGLIIFGGQSVHPTGKGHQTSALGRKVVARYQRITDVVHRHGAHISAQLVHAGTRDLTFSETGLEWRIAYGPSRRPKFGTIVRPIDQGRIQQIVEDYRVAARNVKAGGFDGLEVRLNWGLLGEFISGISNQRGDEYSRTLENRMRFPLEVLRAVRDEVGANFLIDARACVDEVVPGGFEVEEGQEIGRMIAGTGAVDLFNTAIGIPDEYGEIGRVYLQQVYPLPLGHAVYAGEALKKAVNLPVITQGRITDPRQAEQVLAEGKGDLIGMARALIADPEFALKAMEGRLDDIRKCIGYHDVCNGRNPSGRPLTCVWNPAAGREKELGVSTLKLAKVRKTVTVIGGGPAGLKVAEVAARRGHQVNLYDRGQQLGGQINLAVRLPYREHLGEIATLSGRSSPEIGCGGNR